MLGFTVATGTVFWSPDLGGHLFGSLGTGGRNGQSGSGFRSGNSKSSLSEENEIGLKLGQNKNGGTVYVYVLLYYM